MTGSITNAQLAGSITNAKLSNSSLSYGGVTLALGASDATPAFDLSDATNYPTTSLTGSITNAQLAGSIDLTSKVTNILPIANGGTGGETNLSARTSLGIISGSITLDGTNSTIVTSDVGVDTGYIVTATFSVNSIQRSIMTAIANSNGTITIVTLGTPANNDKISFIAIDSN